MAVIGASSKSAIGELKQWVVVFQLLYCTRHPPFIPRFSYQLSDYRSPLLSLESFVMDGIQYLFPIHLSSGDVAITRADAGIHDKEVPLHDSLWNVVADDKISCVRDRDLTLTQHCSYNLEGSTGTVLCTV